MASKICVSRLPPVIVPSKCAVDDFEILAFETEDELNLYSIWQEILADKRRESNATSDRERQIIRDQLCKRTAQYLQGTHEKKLTTTKPIATNKRSLLASANPTHSTTNQAQATQRTFPSPLKSTPTQPRTLLQQPALRNGLVILNSIHQTSTPASKQFMKYKFTKLYNKYRGRQIRRTFVHDKQRNAKIEIEESKCYLNSWLAYTALQALHLPDNNLNQLSAVTNTNTKFLTTISPQVPIAQSPATSANQSLKGGKASAKKQQPQQPHQTAPPMHLVYIDPGNIITYSNKINPQQVAEYRKKSHLLPPSATSKKSSAASYDVYEIMDVLANTSKTNVTITRNANRTAQPGSSVYSHSINPNNPGIVSTQLHLQAKSYVDTVRKIFAEERWRLDQMTHEMEMQDQSPVIKDESSDDEVSDLEEMEREIRELRANMKIN